jgi:hypothetical protein
MELSLLRASVDEVHSLRMIVKISEVFAASECEGGLRFNNPAENGTLASSSFGCLLQSVSDGVWTNSTYS